MPAPAAPAAPVSPARMGGQGFSGVYAQLRDEVVDSIRHGFSTASSAASAAMSWTPPQTAAAAAQAEAAQDAVPASDEQRRGFLDRIAPWAEQVASRLGVSGELIAAHAALESGWGRQPVRTGDGASTYNLFGIKAGGEWSGATADTLTTEHLGGEAMRLVQRFRAYSDYGSAFDDYARLLQLPRYAGARDAGDDVRSFARGLVEGGYATDPAYAHKLEQVARQIQRLSAP